MLRMPPCTDLSSAGLTRGKRSDTSVCPVGRGGLRSQPVSKRAVRFTSAPHSPSPRTAGQSTDGPSSSTSEVSGQGTQPQTEWLVHIGPPLRTLMKAKPPSSLLMAASSGDSRWLKECLASSKPGDVNQLGVEGFSPLHMAAKHGHVACLQLLVAWKTTDVAIVTAPDGKTALHLSVNAKRQRVQSVKLLIRAGTPVNQGDWNHTTPLHTSASLGHVGCMMALLDAGADSCAVDKLNRRPLDLAKQSGKAECLRRLRAVQWAAAKDHAEVTRRLKAHSEEMQRVHRTKQQKLEQAVRGEEAFNDWLTAKGLSSTSSVSLSSRHTRSSLCHVRDVDPDAVCSSVMATPAASSAASSHACSRLSSKCNSMWSVYSAPATMSHATEEDTVTRLISPSLPALLSASVVATPTMPKPIKVNFQHKHQHKPIPQLRPRKSPHAGGSPNSKAKRVRLAGVGCSSTSRRKEAGKQRSMPPRAATPHPLKHGNPEQAPPEESMATEGTAPPDLPQVRIEELLLKDRHQLPSLKTLAWGSNHQLQAGPIDAVPNAWPGVQRAEQQSLPVMRPLRANSLRLAVICKTNLEVVDEETESASSSVSDIDAYLGPTHSCLQLLCSDGMESPCSGSSSDISLCSAEMFDRMSLSDD